VESVAYRVHQNIDNPRILQAFHSVAFPDTPVRTYNLSMERKIFWITFTLLGLIADFVLPLWWALGATIPILFVSWWVAYRSDWF
jgi:hypothetical protein